MKAVSAYKLRGGIELRIRSPLTDPILTSRVHPPMNEEHASARTLIELFNQAQAQPAGEQREQFLAEACGGDERLCHEVRLLLQAESSAGDFLDAGTRGPDAGPRMEEAGERIGHYKLLERIGQGGFGTVWVAEQERPVRRRVALKIIKLGMDTKEVIARFEQERQALAMMDHPNIAKVFDAGATETGRPYFVMELVRGVKITEYCDGANLSTAERLQLFVAVCQAVQHAHQKGIIHRDLKPSNILVTLHDGVAVPKVIDFGVAKATQQQRLTDLTIYTQFEQMVGTPLYMSPEQAELSGLDIDTRSDIYSLGVLLYELLTGRTPFDPETLMRQGLEEIRRAIREQEPQRPSTFVQTMPFALRTTVAKHRQADALKLVTQIRGDLDWIVMKAMEKDRNRRYETATGFAKDIERHLNNEPVQARPPSRGYQFQKLVRRNKLAVAATGAVAAALLIGLGTATWMFIKERHARKRAELAEIAQSQLTRKAEAEEQKAKEARENEAAMRSRAETEAARSSAVARFLQDMLKGVGPAAARGRDTTMLREIRENTAKRLEELKGQPAVEADLRETLGTVYSELGEYPTATTMHQQALALRKELFGNEHPLVAASLFGLANVLINQGRWPEAEAMHRDALAMRITLFGNKHVDVAESLNNLALVLRHQGKKPEAESASREAYEIYMQLFGEEHLMVAEALHALAWNVHELRKHAEAESLSRRELAIRRKLRGEDHPSVGWALVDLTSYLRAQGKLQEAEAALREALEIARKQSADDPGTATLFLRQLGFVLRGQGRPADAEVVWREELAIRRKVSGNDHPEVATALHVLAFALYDQRKFAEAETAVREVLRIRTARLDEDHVDVAAAVNSLVDVHVATGRMTEAEALIREQIARRKERYGGNHRKVSDALQWLAKFLHKQRKLTEAEVALREVLAVERNLSPEGDPLIANAALDLAVLLRDSGRHAEAEPLLREALEIRRKVLGDEQAETLFAMSLFAGTLQTLGKHPEALALCREMLASRKKDYGEESAKAAESLADLASALQKAGEIAEADRTFQEALALCRKLPESTALAAEVLAKWGSFLESQQRFGEAVTAYREELELRRKVHGDIHRNVEEALGQLALSLESQGKLDEAEAVFREELAMEKKLSGDEHPFVANSYDFLGKNLVAQGKHAEAEECFREALLLRKKLGHDDLTHFDLLARALVAQGKRKELQTLVEMEVGPVLAQVSGNHALNASVGVFLHHAALALHTAKLFKEARPLAEEAWTLYEQHPDWPENERQHAFQVLAAVLRDLGDHAAIEPLQRQVIDRLRAKVPAEDAQLAGALAELTLHLLTQQKFSEAEAPARESLAIREKTMPDQWPTFNSRSLLGGSLLGQKKFAEAEPLLFSGYEGMKQRENSIPVAGKVRLGEALKRLGELYEATGDTDKAVEWKKKMAELEQGGATPARAVSKE